MEPRLKSEIWIKAHIRRCAVEGVPATVVRRGEESAGAILIKVNRLDGYAIVYVQTRLGDGTPVWTRGSGPAPLGEAEADAYIERQLRFDPDLWVLEIEDRDGRHFLDNVEEGTET